MGRLDLVTYDLDGTLINGTAFLVVARAFGFDGEVLEHDRRFRAGEITLEECFDIEFGLLAGRRLDEVQEAMAGGTWFAGIKDAVDLLKEAGLRVAVLTDNPDLLLEHLRTFGIDEWVSSRGEVKDGLITGDVEASFDKWANLAGFLEREGIDASRVAHIGNDVNDAKVWQHVGHAVCVEPTSPKVAEAADVVFGILEHHLPVAQHVVQWHRAG